MILTMDHAFDGAHVGNKAKNLHTLNGLGFNVPKTLVLPSDLFKDFLAFNKIEKKLNQLISKIEISFCEKSVGEINQLFMNTKLPDAVLKGLENHIDSNKFYAVRSSGIKEDLDKASFAGQYKSLLNVKGINPIEDAIIQVYASLFQSTTLLYALENNINLKELSMALIIQDMVDARTSGVVFSVDPVTGLDCHMVIEANQGLGDNLVNGKVRPEKYIYDWYKEKHIEYKNEKLLTKTEIEIIAKKTLEIQLHFGYPVDIEFAFEDSLLYLLQVRPITKIKHLTLHSEWSTANFKDGGVSSASCLPCMWSLHEYAFSHAMPQFINDSGLIKGGVNDPVFKVVFGRFYWNVSLAKKALSHIPGYKESDLDKDIGIKPSYEGKGQYTPFSLKNIMKVLPIIPRKKKLLKKHDANSKLLKVSHVKKYERYMALSLEDFSLSESQILWQEIVMDDFFKSETIYFTKILMNVVEQVIIKNELLKYMDIAGYLDLMSGLKNLSHIRPSIEMWDISRVILKNPDAMKFWDKPVEEICHEYEKGCSLFSLDLVRQFIDAYGYHSRKELEIAYPNYHEDMTFVIEMIKEYRLFDDRKNPRKTQNASYEKHTLALAHLKKKVNKIKYPGLEKKIHEFRDMLWWREELRDISARFYCVIRKIFLKLATLYVEAGFIDHIEDIWFATIFEIDAFIKKEISVVEFKTIIEKNKQYYTSFKNYSAENEIGQAYDTLSLTSPEKNALSGVPCNGGIIKGIARVINDLDEISKLQQGDILVTKFTDTGWTSKFPMLNGIITEYGGILCHAAVISREFGIPCIVAMDKSILQIKDGTEITMNGITGEVHL